MLHAAPWRGIRLAPVLPFCRLPIRPSFLPPEETAALLE